MPEVRNKFTAGPGPTVHIEEGDGRTHQSFKDDADVNTIMQKYSRTNVLGSPDGATRQPMFGDFTNVDFQATENKIAIVRNAFGELPSNIRTRFENDPGKLLEFVGDDGNKEECIKLGLLPKDEPIVNEIVTPVDPEVLNPETAPPEPPVVPE